MKQPWLSVVMPTYNGARYVQSALESVVAQEVGDFEFIAVDDGSTDGTLDLLRRYCDRLPMMVVERDHAGNWAAQHERRHAIGKRALSLLASSGRRVVRGPTRPGEAIDLPMA